jgi:hypothetical protein
MVRSQPSLMQVFFPWLFGGNILYLMQLNKIYGGSKTLVTLEDTTILIFFLCSKPNVLLHMFSSFRLPSFSITIKHKMDSNMIVFHNKCTQNVICFHQISNPINHCATSSKSIWWKFAWRNGYHIVHPTFVSWIV